jgi:REP element-mobilizing transposase RayT
MEYRKEAHGVISLPHPLIFVVTYRQSGIIKEIGIMEALKTRIMDLSENFELKGVEMEGGMEPVHLLISAKPMGDIPKGINTIKGHFSHFLRKEDKTFLQDKLGGAQFWRPCYFLSSTGNGSIDVLKHHGGNQRRRSALED